MENEFRVSGLSGYRVFTLSRFHGFQRPGLHCFGRTDRWVAPKARDFLGVVGRPIYRAPASLPESGITCYRDYTLSRNRGFGVFQKVGD